MTRRPTIALALGGGAARGWAHIGVINALRERGIEADIVCGTSIGALVGAAHAAGQLAHLEEWVRRLKWQDVVGFLDVTLSKGGVIQGRKVFEQLRRHYRVERIEQLQLPFGAVATNLTNGLEVWLREGAVLDAVRASASLPGLFTPVYHNGHWLVDGGLVNPVPVSLCRAMGAELVIAVDLFAQRSIPAGSEEREERGGEDSWLASAREITARMWEGAVKQRLAGEGRDEPSIFEVVSGSIHIMQMRISRSRMAGEPPNLLITPVVEGIGLMDFHRADEAIEEGVRAVQRIDAQLPLFLRGMVS
ncbi:MAG TPA: patatin-like phospholipase RssA [Gammaproteobacteria bacterium]|nr:patatin-like phospholipase RssA [Gammaproteobacteria bacterium]